MAVDTAPRVRTKCAILTASATHGRRSVVRIPALWIYAENDRSYDADLARHMFDAYAAGGESAQLQVLPPFGLDGRDLITRAPADSWLPSIAPFLP